MALAQATGQTPPRSMFDAISDTAEEGEYLYNRARAKVKRSN